KHVILTSPADYLPAHLAAFYRLNELRSVHGRFHADNKTPRADPTIHSFRALLGHAHGRQGFEVFSLPAPAGPSDVAVLQYTGGTTGVAKGAMLTHRSLLVNALQAWAWNEQPPDSAHITLCVAPFFHVYGLTVGLNLTVLNGSTMV